VNRSDVIRLQYVRAVSDGLLFVCELHDGRRVGIPQERIDPASEVQQVGDVGTLVIPRQLAIDLRIEPWRWG